MRLTTQHIHTLSAEKRKKQRELSQEAAILEQQVQQGKARAASVNEKSKEKKKGTTYLVDGRARIGKQTVGMCKEHLKKFVLKLVCGTHSWPGGRKLR